MVPRRLTSANAPIQAAQACAAIGGQTSGGLAILNGAACDPARGPPWCASICATYPAHTWAVARHDDHRPAVDSDCGALRRRGSERRSSVVGHPRRSRDRGAVIRDLAKLRGQHSVQLRRGRDHDGRGPGTHAGLDPDEPRWRCRRNGHHRGLGKDDINATTNLRAGSTVLSAVTSAVLQTAFAPPSSSVCSGDSGGPLFLLQGGVWTQAGVTSATPSRCATMGRTFTSRCAIPASLRLSCSTFRP